MNDQERNAQHTGSTITELEAMVNRFPLLTDEGQRSSNSQEVIDLFSVARSIAFPLESEKPATDACEECGESSGKLIECADCRDKFCEKTCTYKCVDCAHPVNLCRKCMKVHDEEGHWTDGDTAREMASGLGGAA